jgi:hypothetical protein
MLPKIFESLRKTAKKDLTRYGAYHTIRLLFPPNLFRIVSASVDSLDSLSVPIIPLYFRFRSLEN